MTEEREAQLKKDLAALDSKANSLERENEKSQEEIRRLMYEYAMGGEADRFTALTRKEAESQKAARVSQIAEGATWVRPEDSITDLFHETMQASEKAAEPEPKDTTNRAEKYITLAEKQGREWEALNEKRKLEIPEPEKIDPRKKYRPGNLNERWRSAKTTPAVTPESTERATKIAEIRARIEKDFQAVGGTLGIMGNDRAVKIAAIRAGIEGNSPPGRISVKSLREEVEQEKDIESGSAELTTSQKSERKATIKERVEEIKRKIERPVISYTREERKAHLSWLKIQLGQLRNRKLDKKLQEVINKRISEIIPLDIEDGIKEDIPDNYSPANLRKYKKWLETQLRWPELISYENGRLKNDILKRIQEVKIILEKKNSEGRASVGTSRLEIPQPDETRTVLKDSEAKRALKIAQIRATIERNSSQ